MKVFKFGGASVSTTERIENVGKILQSYQGEKILVVISAIGKTTNALEKVVEAFYNQEKGKALELFIEVKQTHIETCEQLDISSDNLNDFFTEAEWLLHDKPVRHYDYYYDQLVCIGELLSTAIVSEYLNKSGVTNKWVDVRDVIRTDSNFRDARLDWQVTTDKTQEIINPLFDETDIVITQGFIGATDENETTTLGREGSDYTAAIFANLFDAESLTIWKDVQGVMNADPKEYEKAIWIEKLNYKEVIEMAYYGAQVIHPKTIKPLQNKNIPLIVKSFINPDAEGTTITNESLNKLPPIIVYKKDQVLVQLKSKDFSFVGEGLTAEIYKFFADIKFKPNLTQNAAISFLCVTDNLPEKIEAFAHAASSNFDVQIKKNLTLLSVRHCEQQLYDSLMNGKRTVLKQETPETVQVLIEE